MRAKSLGELLAALSGGVTWRWEKDGMALSPRATLSMLSRDERSLPVTMRLTARGIEVHLEGCSQSLGTVEVWEPITTASLFEEGQSGSGG